MIGVGVVCPMLLHPIVFASTNEICSEAEDVVDPCAFGCGTVIGIVLYVEADEGLGDTECDGEWDGCGGGVGPEVVHGCHEADVEEGTGEVSWCTEFTSSADYFEDFTFDFTFEFCVP